MSNYNVHNNHPILPHPQTFNQKSEYVSFHSDDRDNTKWKSSSHFELTLPQKIKNTFQMKLTDFVYPKDMPNISSNYYNNYIICALNTTKNGIHDTAFQNNKGGIQHFDYDSTQAPTTDFITSNNIWVQNIDNTYTYFEKLDVITLPTGLYGAVDLANALQFKLNDYYSKISVGDNGIGPDYYGFHVAYDPVKKNFIIGNNIDQFGLFFGPDAISSVSNLLSQCNTQNTITQVYDRKSYWGLGYMLGFNKLNYGYQTTSNVALALNSNLISLKDSNVVNDTNNSKSFVSSVIPDFNIWIGAPPHSNAYVNSTQGGVSEGITHPVTGNTIYNINNGDTQEVYKTSYIIPATFNGIVDLPPVFYMSINKYNSGDTLYPFPQENTNYNPTNYNEFTNNSTCCGQICNTNNIFRDTSEYIKNKSLNASCMQQTKTPKQNYNVSSFFAKIPSNTAQPIYKSNSNTANGYSIFNANQITSFYQIPEADISKLEFSFFFHNGMIVDFGNSDITFTIEFTTFTNTMDKDYKILMHN